MPHSVKRCAVVHAKVKRRSSSSKHHRTNNNGLCVPNTFKKSKKSQIDKTNKKAKVKHCKSNGPKRTKVTQHLRLLSYWKRKFANDNLFRFRVISRRYFRKLSTETSPPTSGRSNRKVSWGTEIEVVMFDQS
jgi:hypothetical protein